MTSDELEARAASAIRSAEAGGRNEDTLVELKSEWPDRDDDFARRLAAHANSVAGHDFVWLIGLRDGVGVRDVATRDPADWWPQIESHFDGPAPELQVFRNLALPTGTVVALGFAALKAPYVIKRSDDKFSREVPWRRQTMTRSATRDELVRLLDRVVLLPEARPVRGNLTWVVADQIDLSLVWDVRFLLRVTPRGSHPLVIPYSGIRVAIKSPGTGESLELTAEIDRPDDPTPTLTHGTGELTFLASNTISIGTFNSRTPLLNRPERLEIELALQPAGTEETLHVVTRWIERPEGTNGHWGYWIPDETLNRWR